MIVKMEKEAKIAVSVLNIPIKEIPNAINEMAEEIDLIHIDVMDGKFVTNCTNGVEMFKMAQNSNVKIPIDVHLMIENPDAALPDYKGADIITFHIEAVKSEKEAKNLINKIKNIGAKVGVSIKPNTTADTLKSLLPYIDVILLMTVEPGYGGQKLLFEPLEKIGELRKMGFEKIIEVDGGISLENSDIVRKMGADILVAGTAVFSSKDKLEAIKRLKGIS